MEVKKPEQCMDMSDVRREIDRLDQALVALISERFTYVDRAWQLKEKREDAVVPWRIQEVIEKVKAHADDQNLDPSLVEALWRQMIGWFVQYEEEKLAAKADGEQ